MNPETVERARSPRGNLGKTRAGRIFSGELIGADGRLMEMSRKVWFLYATASLALAASGFSQSFLSQYKGVPYHDSRYQAGPQKVPGQVLCAYYDLGGEGAAYHDTDPKNHGSGELNPADGTYLNEFRIHEGVDTSYTKFDRKPDPIDDNPYDKIVPPRDLPYVGWTEPGEWFNVTIDVAQAGTYAADFLYTSNRGGTHISRCEWKRRHRTFADRFHIRSSRSDRLAPMASLESGFAPFQGSSQQRTECSHRAHLDRRKHESGLF